MDNALSTPKTNRGLILWLWLIIGLTVVMVVVGGVTRLTHSGLSITNWRPLLGAIPPMNPQEWQDTFARYQEFPEYQKLNVGMTLGEFKKIFFWEYLHRLLGRLIGVVFLLPWLWFAYRKKIPKGMNLKFAGLFALGALQGIMGWYMVRSGLVDNPTVSHYRLAAHLLLAFAVMVVALKLIFKLGGREQGENTPPVLLRLSYTITGVIILQIIYGAFTAGLKAGFMMNTFPKMNGEWIPSLAFGMTPFWHNFVQNSFGVQFIHRSLGWLLLFGIISFWLASRKAHLNPTQRKAIHHLLAMTVVQFALGVVTLVLVVPIHPAVTHQVGACVLLLLAVTVNHSLAPPKKQ